MFGREVERREYVPVVLDFGAVGHGIAQAGKDLDNLVFDQRNRMARTELFGRAGTGHVLRGGAVAFRGVLQLFAQVVYLFERRGLELVELLTELAFELRGHRFELLHQGVQFAFLAEDFDAELLDFGCCLRFELFDTSEEFIDFVGHILIVYAFSLLLPII